MRGAAFLALLVFSLWFVFALRRCTPEFTRSVCTQLCDIRGRTLRDVRPGLITYCFCGSRKTVPGNLDRP